jgi:hypothetical protein
MSHCYSVGVNVGGAEKEICTLVPGNEDLAKHVKEMEATGGKTREPTNEEVDRAIDFHLNNHSDKDHPAEPEEETKN